MQPDHTEPGSKTAVVFLAILSLLIGYAILVGGVPIAQSHGDSRLHALTSILLAALFGLIYQFVLPDKPSVRSWSGRLALLLPSYALLQVVPLPLTVVRLLSPARAALVDALGTAVPASSWTPLSVTPSATLFHFLLLASCTTLFFVTYDLTAKFATRPWLMVLPLVVLAAAESILGLVQASGPGDSAAIGTFSIRNHFAGFLEMILPLAALYPFSVLASREPGTKTDMVPALRSCGALGISALIVTGILSSLSRMGFVSALISMTLVSIAAIAPGKSRSRFALTSAGIALIALVSLIAVPSAKLVMRFGEMEQSNEDRSPVWRETLGLIAAYPVFGCGLGGYESAFLPYKKSNPALNQDYAHNDYLQYLAELGAAGLAFAALPLAILIRRLLAAYRYATGPRWWLALACAGSLIAIAIHSFVDFNLYVPANLFTLAWILGMAAAVGRSSLGHGATGLQPAAIIEAPMTPARSR